MRPSALIICATPRSGTTLLCDLLAETGVTGTPNSFYRRESVANFASRLGVAEGPDFERRYLAAITAEGRGTSDLFSMRVMWPSVATMRDALSAVFPGQTSYAARIAAAFGTPLYLFVERRDKVAQAISRIKAEQSGLWGIAPLELSYEELAADPVAALRGLLTALDRDASAADRAAPRTSKLADAASRDWAERFARGD